MWWPPAQEPEDSREEPGEPTQWDASGSPQFPDETLRPFTGEVLSSGSFSSSAEEQSCSYISESKLESDEPTTSSEGRNQQPELSDSQRNENKVSEKWISYLKGKKTHSEECQSDSRLHIEVPRASEEELRALQSFCSVKVNLIYRRENSKAKKGSRHKRLQFRLDAETPEVDALNCTIPGELLNRIYLENTRATLKQMATAKQHVSAKCPSCLSKRAELAQSDFLKRKKTLLESLLLQEKIDEHLHTTDFLTRVGEAHQSLPRLSDDPTKIWKRLTEKIQMGSSDVERADAKHM
ncbi:uncharacterized protein C8orf48 homolog [Nannospalax galili]|uniref:uncharacterized protein C8orf48 homolog n=1 Tax=Nannospalax galili TaxID=1026970 RepID=UPI0004ED4C6F|nr:uncharacterized protein C8orf48 homolog [Nannospalax galili]